MVQRWGVGSQSLMREKLLGMEVDGVVWCGGGAGLNCWATAGVRIFKSI